MTEEVIKACMLSSMLIPSLCDDDDQVITELVRLTNEDAVKEQTDENGDLFLWFKHQAFQGVVHAQVIYLAISLVAAAVRNSVLK